MIKNDVKKKKMIATTYTNKGVPSISITQLYKI